MKHLLLFMSLSISFISIEAQQTSKSRFAFVSITYDAKDEMYDIKIDSGQAPITRRGPLMTDSFGQVMKFVSDAAALNYLDNVGWKLLEVLPITGGSSGSGSGSVATTLSYL